MRVLLFTGKGGVGKTTTSAATAVHAALRGHKTLVLSTDPAHSLADALGVRLGDEPTEIGDGSVGGLYGQQVDTQRAFEQSWREVSHYLRDLLEQGGVDPIEAEELTVLPGAEEILALLELRAQVDSGRWDVVVVDCAPTAETLRLLALPEALSWWTQRVFAPERRMSRALRPVLSHLVGVPLPPDRVFTAVERLQGELGEVRRLLTDPVTSSVRLVLTPEAVVVAEARRTLTSLALHGYRVDGVVANRVFTDDGDPWRAGWAAAQATQLDTIAQSFTGVPLWRAAYQPGEPVGLSALAAFSEDLYAAAASPLPTRPGTPNDSRPGTAKDSRSGRASPPSAGPAPAAADYAAAELSGAADPLAVATTPEPMSVERVATDEFVLSVALPLADKRDVDLVRKGDELVLTVGSHRRVLALPAVLRRCVVDGAALRDGRLRVRFRPDPDLWMRS
ncbi:MAG TPA: ArsA family ATPase [Mycobacteriales bacterium]|nr:ArsA family ATPase [Mycobacteriales bacterium]